MRSMGSLLAMAVFLTGCGIIPSLATCPGAAAVEKSYDVTTTCVGGGDARFSLTGYSENHRNDCPSGCFSTADAVVRLDDGGVNTSGEYASSCGSDPGTVFLHLSRSGLSASCDVPFPVDGGTLSCFERDGGSCTATVTPAG